MNETKLPVGDKTKNGRYRLLGYRALVEILKEDALRDSWLWTPSDTQHKFRAARVIQVGRYRRTNKRTEHEFKSGDKVLIDGNFGAKEIVDGDRRLLIVSVRDVAAIIT